MGERVKLEFFRVPLFFLLTQIFCSLCATVRANLLSQFFSVSLGHFYKGWGQKLFSFFHCCIDLDLLIHITQSQKSKEGL